MSLKVSDLSKRYGSEWILRNVTFEAEPGSVTGILGVTGSGKTTLLKMIAGTESSNGGTITFDSLNGSQNSLLIPTMPGSSFLQRAFGGQSSDTAEAARRQAEAIENALTGNNKLILLDDALLLFDQETKKRYVDEIARKASEQDVTVVYTTANFDDVLAMCNKAVVISNGTVLQTGIPEEIYDAPESSTVSKLTGRTNLIEARRLTSSKTELPQFQTIKGEHRLFAQKAGKGELGAINQNVHLAIRPEQLSISFGASFPEDNLLKAKIAAIRFLGPLTLVDLDANGLILQAYVTRLIGLNIGDECMVSLPPDRIRILKH